MWNHTYTTEPLFKLVLFTTAYVNTAIQYDRNTYVSTCRKTYILFNTDIIFAIYVSQVVSI